MKLSELYTSVQGEGPNVGKPIQFVRFGGCNMRCPGWPCDTQYAIDPQYRNQWGEIQPKELFDRVADWPKHVCLTGGEPLIQRKAQMEEFGELLINHYFAIDIFTNGSQPFPLWREDKKAEVTIVMDWKLPGSGEEYSGIVQREENRKLLGPHDAVKFVVKDLNDLITANDLYSQWCVETGGLGPEFQVYVGKVWDTELTDKDIVDFVTKFELPWVLNMQVHKYIWTPTQRGV